MQSSGGSQQGQAILYCEYKAEALWHDMILCWLRLNLCIFYVVQSYLKLKSYDLCEMIVLYNILI